MSNLHFVSRRPVCRYFQPLVFSLFLFSALVHNLDAQTIFALSGNNLVSFDATAPGAILSNKALSGIAAGQDISGMDFRPNTGELYALGYNQMSGEARIYTINSSTAVATPVGAAPVMLKPGLGKIGFDFNPTVDRIRVTGSDNTNYRMHPVTGAIAATDGSLAFSGTDVNAGKDPSVGAVAYTNSYIGTTSTTLYNYDDSLNIVTAQIPPNNGTLNTVGASGITVNLNDQSTDMDIFFDAAGGINRAFLAANIGTDIADNLYTIDLATGMVSLIGTAGIPLRDIAVVIDRTVPATVTGQLIYALTSNNNLVTFDSNLPGTIRNLYAVTGISAGQVLSGLDSRPATGELYGLGYNQVTGEVRLYTINPSTGAATAIGAGPVVLKPGMGKIGFDFNPTVDRIRVVGSDNSNFRLHPVTGAIAATDGIMAFAATDANAGKDPSVGAVAYTNSFNGATATTLYNYEDSLNIITSQIPPNNGTLNTVGVSGITLNLTDPSADMDIYYNPFTGMNRAYLSANAATSMSDGFYTVDLATGAVSLLGRIGNGIAITDIAAAIQPAESACDVKMINCMKYEMLSVTKDASGNKTYRIRVTNNCADNLFYTAFGLPKGVVADGPANNAAYNSPGGHSYEVRNPSFSPFYSVRFKDQGAGIANGQMDILQYTLPAYSSPNYIHVISRTGAQTYHEAYLNVFNCTVTASSQFTSDKAAAEDREDGVEMVEARALQVYPNPTSGNLFADLSPWSDQLVHIQVFTAQGQQVQSYVAQGGDIKQINLPESLTDGVYFLKFAMEDSMVRTERVLLRR
jgi:3D (Asp-Asp-Asp) domain-containing protein